MVKDTHPTIQRFLETQPPPARPVCLDSAELKSLARQAGADDAGIIQNRQGGHR